MTSQPADNTSRAERIGGGLLIVTAVLTVALILHHPSLSGGQSLNHTAIAMGKLATMDRLVHGGLMVVLGLQVVCFHIFSVRLGFRHPAVAAGFLAFAGAVLVMVVPATLDGFVTPVLAANCLKAAGGCGAGDAGALRLVGAMIQEFTKVALVLTGVAIAAWSVALLGFGGWLRRGAGVIGLVCAAVPTLVLLGSDVYLRANNLVDFIAAQVVWSLVVGFLMIRRV